MLEHHELNLFLYLTKVRKSMGFVERPAQSSTANRMGRVVVFANIRKSIRREEKEKMQKINGRIQCCGIFLPCMSLFWNRNCFKKPCAVAVGDAYLVKMSELARQMGETNTFGQRSFTCKLFTTFCNSSRRFCSVSFDDNFLQ